MYAPQVNKETSNFFLNWMIMCVMSTVPIDPTK